MKFLISFIDTLDYKEETEDKYKIELLLKALESTIEHCELYLNFKLLGSKWK